jgi:hypothetical protein
LTWIVLRSWLPDYAKIRLINNIPLILFMDEAKFSQIDSFYKRRRNSLMLDRSSQRTTAAGYWAASEPGQVFELFKKLDLERYKSFVDLGSGDGIVVAVASLFTKSEGIEADSRLHADAVEMMGQLGLDYSLRNADYLQEDLSMYDFVFINPDNHFHLLERKLVEGFKGVLVITDNLFRPLTLKPERHIAVGGAVFSVYILNKKD